MQCATFLCCKNNSEPLLAWGTCLQVSQANNEIPVRIKIKNQKLTMKKIYFYKKRKSKFYTNKERRQIIWVLNRQRISLENVAFTHSQGMIRLEFERDAFQVTRTMAVWDHMLQKDTYRLFSCAALWELHAGCGYVHIGSKNEVSLYNSGAASLNFTRRVRSASHPLT